jgi:hypothetical protein
MSTGGHVGCSWSLFLALVPASGEQAQIVGPGCTVPPSIGYGLLFPDENRP